MKTRNALALLLLGGIFVSGCATVSRLNADDEQEQARIQKMSSEEQAERRKTQLEALQPGNLHTR